jgi:hypothetical protein
MTNNALTDKRLFYSSIWLVLIVIISLSLPARIHGEESRAVTLLYFEGEGRNSEILLRWATATEVDTSGFMLERSQNAAGPYQALSNIGFIPFLAQDAFSGAEYQRLDRTSIVSEQTYYYVLVEFEVDGTEIRTDPILVESSQVELTVTADGNELTQQPSVTPSANVPSSTVTPGAIPTTGAVSPGTELSVTTNANAYPAPGSGEANQNQAPLAFSQTNNGNSGGVDQANSLLAVTPTFEGYPAPPGSDQSATFGRGQSYPGPATIIGSPPPASGYPAANNDTQGLSESAQDREPNSIGDSKDLTISDSENNLQNEASILSTLILWIGFFAALAIFTAGVAGAIHLFSKRRIRNR